jgi:peptide-methionine (R)-S-oxide reductase
MWAKNSDHPAKTTRTDEEWKKRLPPEQYRVTWQHGTERAFSNPLNDEKRGGMFQCGCCGAPLFAPIPNSIRALAGRVFGRRAQ